MAGPRPLLPSARRRGLYGVAKQARDLFLQNLDYLEPALTPISILGAIAFPLYFWVWAYLFPQPYENLPLRLIGTALFALALTRHHWPAAVRRFEPLFWYLTCLYALPFFFTYMMLMSAASQVSQMAAMVMTFLLVLVVDWLNLIIMIVIGTLLGWLCFYLTEGVVLPDDFDAEWIPVMLFVVAFGSVVNYRAELAKRERMRALLAAAGNIAHEMRTPLLAIKAGAVGLERHLPTLLGAYRKARDGGLDVDKIRQAQLDGMEKVPARIIAETDYANVIIDMLLANAGRTAPPPEQFGTYSMAGCIEQALGRYVFKSTAERGRIQWSAEQDFDFRGSDLLVIHVLFNLIKNALYFVNQAGHGDISVRMERRSEANFLFFRDTGAGIPADRLTRIFEAFYSSLEHGTGTGMGLAFCKMVMESLGGRIACRSEPGRFTEFELRFPKV